MKPKMSLYGDFRNVGSLFLPFSFTSLHPLACLDFTVYNLQTYVSGFRKFLANMTYRSLFAEKISQNRSEFTFGAPNGRNTSFENRVKMSSKNIKVCRNEIFDINELIFFLLDRIYTKQPFRKGRTHSC